MNNKIGTVIIFTTLISSLVFIGIDIAKAAYMTIDTDKVESLIEITDIVEKETLKSIDSTHFNVPNYSNKTFISWSPDGSKLLILIQTYLTTKNITADDKKNLERCNPGFPFGIPESVSTLFLINADGTQITDIARAEESARAAKNSTFGIIQSTWWSSDSGKIIFKVRNYCEENKLIVSDINGSIQTEVKGLDDPFIRWSLDGSQAVIIDGGKENSRILIFDVENSTIEQIPLSTSAIGYSAAWNPDGNKIAFIGFKNGGIYTVNTDTFSVQQFTTGVQAIELAWEPNGKKLVFTAEDGIYVLNTDDSALTLIENGTFGIESWNPDGKKLLFGMYDKKGLNKVYALDIDGMSTKLIPYMISQITWSPNGNRIAFRIDSSSSIYTVNSDGTDKVTLPESYSINMEGVYGWGLDNKIYYITNYSLIKVNPEGTEPLPLIKNLSTAVYNYNKIYLSPDGNRILFTVRDSSDEREHNYILKMKGYDEVMSIYVPRSLREADDAFIEVKSMSKPVENAIVFFNGREIGKTNETGVLRYNFKEAGNYRLTSVKQGFRTANKSITIKERQQLPELTVDKATPAPIVAGDTPITPGFSSIFAVIALILTIYQIKKNEEN
ncbi:MAG: PEGA domain-containing protein [Candidatus Methanoperedens sp.]|nr:PEGA domain-containing protein [Candidatus Methanoperedens sp.]